METETETRLDELTRLYVRAKLNAETAQKSLEDVSELLKREMKATRVRELDVQVGERHYRLAYRQRFTYDFDLDRLKERLHPEVWRRVATTRTTISKVALEKELTAGTVSPEDVGEYVHERKGASWVDMKETDGQARADESDEQA